MSTFSDLVFSSGFSDKSDRSDGSDRSDFWVGGMIKPGSGPRLVGLWLLQWLQRHAFHIISIGDFLRGRAGGFGLFGLFGRFGGF